MMARSHAAKVLHAIDDMLASTDTAPRVALDRSRSSRT
jgi:hypothetical protein